MWFIVCFRGGVMNFFVTGTDTDVGKTVVCAWLAHHLNLDYWKPIQCGPDRDAKTVRDLGGLSVDRIHPERYLLQAPLSPHTAAAMEEIYIDSQFKLPHSSRPLIVEGAGGVLVPLNNQMLVIDLIQDLGLPVLVVSRSGLGTINHTCLTLNALRSKNIPILGVVMNGSKNPANKEALEFYGKVPVLAEIELFPRLTQRALADYPVPDLLRKACGVIQ